MLPTGSQPLTPDPPGANPGRWRAGAARVAIAMSGAGLCSQLGVRGAEGRLIAV